MPSIIFSWYLYFLYIWLHLASYPCLDEILFSDVEINLNNFDLSQIAFTFVVYPSLILAYMGQAAYLSTHHEMENDHRIGFYVSVPGQFLILGEKCFKINEW